MSVEKVPGGGGGLDGAGDKIGKGGDPTNPKTENVDEIARESFVSEARDNTLNELGDRKISKETPKGSEFDKTINVGEKRFPSGSDTLEQPEFSFEDVWSKQKELDKIEVRIGELDLQEAELNEELASKVQNLEDVKNTMDRQQVVSDEWIELIKKKQDLRQGFRKQVEEGISVLKSKEAKLNEELAPKVQNLANPEDVKSTMDRQQVVDYELIQFKFLLDIIAIDEEIEQQFPGIASSLMLAKEKLLGKKFGQRET